jgi:acyl-CoA thioesterase II
VHSPRLADIVATLDVAQTGADRFVATQLDNAHHHIVGGHIAGQALVAAGRTAPDRRPHSFHVFLLRAGDARHPVEFEVNRLRDGGALATRRVTGRQHGEVLLEALTSFTTPVPGVEYHQPLPDVPDPEALVSMQEQLRSYADEMDGYWVRAQPFELRYADPPPRQAVDLPDPSPRIRLWWRPNGAVGEDPLLHNALLAYVSGTTVLETTMTMRRTTQVSVFNALIDHAMWFHRPPRLSDWVLSDQVSPSGVDGRGLAGATMFNRGGELVCTVTQEVYFGRSTPADAPAAAAASAQQPGGHA